MGDRGDEGFSLMEMLVALGIIITMSILLYRGFAGGLNAADSAAGAEAALLVAQSRLAALGLETPLRAGEEEGTESGVLWHMSVRPYAAEDEGIVPAAAGPAAAVPKAFWARVTVVWRERRGRAHRSLQLTTLKLELPK